MEPIEIDRLAATDVQPQLRRHLPAQSRLRQRRDRPCMIVDLSEWTDPDTATFARLIQLRRHLRSRGSDLHVTGLTGKAQSLYHICRLQSILPEA